MVRAAAFYRVCTLSLLRRLRRCIPASPAKVDHDPRRRDCAKFWYNTGSTASAFSAAGRHPRRGGSLCCLLGGGAARPGVQLFRYRRGCRAAIVSIFGTIYLQAAKVGRCRRCRSARFNGLFTARV